jgi:hypothetical protein
MPKAVPRHESPIGCADAYLYAAVALHADRPSGRYYEAPVLYLYFHTAELYLKSFLTL